MRALPRELRPIGPGEGAVERAEGKMAPTRGRRPFERMRSMPRPGLRWADLLRRIYDIDMRSCPNCGPGRLEPIATILDPDAIARILTAMDRFARAPPGRCCRRHLETVTPAIPSRQSPPRRARQAASTHGRRRHRSHSLALQPTRMPGPTHRARPASAADPAFWWPPPTKPRPHRRSTSEAERRLFFLSSSRKTTGLGGWQRRPRSLLRRGVIQALSYPRISGRVDDRIS
jgi:hypothetical protein